MKCYQCKAEILPNDDAGVCIQCGGLSLLDDGDWICNTCKHKSKSWEDKPCIDCGTGLHYTIKYEANNR